MKKTILGIFPKHEDADRALFHLKDEGFKASEVSVIAREDTMKKYRAEEADNAGTGVLTGGVLGGLAGLLIAATPVIVPGLGLLVAGPLTLLASFATGALAGGLIGALIDMGVSEDTAKSYENKIKNGEVLLAVNASDKDESKVQRILKDHNAEELTTLPSEQRRNTAREASNVAFQR